MIYLTEVAGSGVARKYDTAIKHAIEVLRDFPALGPPRPELGPQVHARIVDPYVILYDFDGEELVLVLRILHGRRNITHDVLREP